MPGTKHVCLRCVDSTFRDAEGRPHAGRAFDSFEELSEHMFEAHGKRPETVPPPKGFPRDDATDTRRLL